MARECPSEGQLRAIMSKRFPADIADARVVHHHCNTHVYVTLDDGTQVVVRICDGPYWTEKADRVGKFKSEQFAWETLGRVDGILTPYVITVDTDEAVVPYPYLIMTHVPGTQMSEVFPTLPHDHQVQLLEEFGALASRIHCMPVDLANVPREVMRWSGLDSDLRGYLLDLTARGLMTAHAHDRLQRLLDLHSTRLAAMDDDVVFLHGDLHFGNILLQQDNERWRICSLVDAELAGIGPRGRELTALEQFSFRQLSEPGMRDAFLRGYGDAYARDDYKLAYLTSELDPDWLNAGLLSTIESADFSDDLDWIDIFSEAPVR